MNDDGLAGIVVGRGVRHTCSEVAAIIGVTRQTVQQTEKRALTKIRRALERHGVRSTADLVEGGCRWQ